MIELTLFGGPEIRDDDGRSVDALLAQPRPVALLAYLAAAGPRPGQFHRRDRIVELFWAESGQEQARRNLRKLVHIVRGALGDDVIVSRGDEELRLSPERVQCDVWMLEEAVQREWLARADEIYRSELLPAFGIPGAAVPAFEQWLGTRRTHYADVAADVAWKLAVRLEGSRAYTDAVRFARRAAQLARYDERRLRRAVELLDRAGDVGSALRLYGELEQRLAELDARPSHETRQLIEALRRR